MTTKPVQEQKCQTITFLRQPYVKTGQGYVSIAWSIAGEPEVIFSYGLTKAYDAGSFTAKSPVELGDNYKYKIEPGMLYYYKISYGPLYYESTFTAAQVAVCTAIYKPVCGVNGNTLGNECIARAEGVQIACMGECPCSVECLDSDGGSYFKYGITKGYEEQGSTVVVSLEDSCDGNLLIEYRCSYENSAAGYIKREEYICENGCQSGFCLSDAPSCRETDNGKDLYTKGTYSFAIGSAVSKVDDYCTGDTLTEGYCLSATEGRQESIVCENGCSDGACIREKCTDSDGGYNVLVAGKATDVSGAVRADTCNDSKILLEAQCGENGIFTEEYTCPYACESGLCTGDYCRDTDNGIIFYQKGQATDKNGGIAGDYCMLEPGLCPQGICPDGPYVVEWYCNGTTQLSDYTFFKCPNGCKNGACNEKQCTHDSDCPQIVCITTPCPQHVCVNGQCVASTEEITEEVKCVFKGSTTVQQCYSDSGAQCEGIEVCVATVTQKEGARVMWKSSCGGYAYTTTDGQNEHANFTCDNCQFQKGDANHDSKVDSTDYVAVRNMINNAQYDCAGDCNSDKEVDYTDIECIQKMMGSCGNSICETGEDDWCPACVNSNPPCKAACTQGTCPEDCLATECENLCGDGTCQENVCLASGCPCAETARTCPEDCTACRADNGQCTDRKGLHTSECRENSSITYACVDNACEPTLKECEGSCSNGVCIGRIACNGCDVSGKCYPIGFRKGNIYCGDDLKFHRTKAKMKQCENNFECASNLCVDGKCIRKNLLKSFMQWLSRN
jgi:hypothetical protein